MRLPFYLIIAALVFGGLGIAWARHQSMAIPLFPNESQTVWLIEARIDFVGVGEAVQVSFDLPDDPPGFEVFADTEQAASPGYGFSIIRQNNERRGEWTRRTASGPQTLYYKAQFVAEPETREEPPVAEEDAPSPQDFVWQEPEATAANQLIEQALQRSSTPESLTRELIKLLTGNDLGQNAELLLSEDPDVTALLSRLINEAGVPARISVGLYLEDARRRQSLTPLLEIYTGERWQAFNPATGEQGIPENLVLWHRGGEAYLDVVGGRDSGVSFSMIRQTVPALELAQAQSQSSANPFAFLGVYRLSIEEQSMFKLLFLLPLGALVVVFMRVVVGLKTSGTFMPILIALAFLQTSLIPGLLSLVSIVALGLLLRSYLSHLNLLLVPRIATLVVLVIFLISILSLIGYQLGFNTGMTITFFPMIIIAWTIERMSILWEEEGPKEVVVQGGGSLLVAVLAYLLMQLPLSNHLSFNFPELNLVVLALIMLMGQYTGYRLTELRRFHDMDMVDDAPGQTQERQP